ncbi:MAG: family 43 glycosylhydrolase, partial [Ruminococcus sp.]|nr:family 43 glycosylhydrolase [Ruminococcus sp.]
MGFHRRAAAALVSAVMCASAAASAAPVSAENAPAVISADAVETMGGITISADKISANNYKNTKFNNPISSEFFCADPTAVEYNGRLYLYGTNDHEQFLKAGPDKDNTYEQIKSLLVFSTDDMVNWVYHGEINVGEVAPWITNSWAPSICSRVEDDGLTHFYLYFSNNGLGTGVITSTDPVTGWTDPLGKPLITSSTPGLSNCPNPFDPGVVIDDNGVGWLSFGAGMASGGTDYMPGSARIVQLGEDMVSFASDFAVIPAPYNFEASELNYINGTYVYTYCSDWNDHSEKWEYDCPVPTGCSMVYMTTKTPLDPDSWEMRGECFKNPGVSGFDYSNNHTHMHKFGGKWYMFYHTLSLKNGMGITGSYRSMCVDEIEVDESTVTITPGGGTKKGVSSLVSVDPFTVNPAAQVNNTADTAYGLTDRHAPTVISSSDGAWVSVKGVEFTADEGGSEQAPAVRELTVIDTIRYDITVTSVTGDTTLSMNPADSSGSDRVGSTEISGTGKYSVTCDIGGSDGMMNMGYFTVDNDEQITFLVDSIVVNGIYVFDLESELTNTREWADGLKNIWNGFSDGDTVYDSDYAAFVYSKTADAIQLFAEPVPEGNTTGNAPLLDKDIAFIANVKGRGRVEVRLDSPTGDVLSAVDFDTDVLTDVYSSDVAAVGGTHDLYFIFSDKDIELAS